MPVFEPSVRLVSTHDPEEGRQQTASGIRAFSFHDALKFGLCVPLNTPAHNRVLPECPPSIQQPPVLRRVRRKRSRDKHSVRLARDSHTCGPKEVCSRRKKNGAPIKGKNLEIIDAVNWHRGRHSACECFFLRQRNPGGAGILADGQQSWRYGGRQRVLAGGGFEIVFSLS